MKIQVKLRILIFCFNIFALTLNYSDSFAQGTLEDYQRAEKVKTESQKVYNAPNSFTWTDDGTFFHYSKQTPQGKEYWIFEAKSGNKKLMFDHEKLAGEVSKISGKTLKPYDLDLNIRSFDPIKNQLVLILENAEWQYKIEESTLEKIKEIPSRGRGYWGQRRDDRVGDPVFSPDKSKSAFIKDNNIFIKNGDIEKQVTFDGVPGHYYAADITWSPDNKKLAALKVRPAEVRKLTLIESAPKSQFQPLFQQRDYVKPGDALPIKTPVLLDLEKDFSYAVESSLIPEQFSISRIAWREDSRSFTFEYNERGHQKYNVIEVNAVQPNAKVLISETSETFIDYSGKNYRKDIADGKEIIWSSERDGWRHLYLIDGKTGNVINQITKGNWVVRNVIHVDEEKRKVIFYASGLNKGEDPYHLHLCSVDFDGSGMQVLTKENANHTITFSPDYKFFIDSYSRQDLPTVSKLVSLDSKPKDLFTIEEAEVNSLYAAGWKEPEIFHAKGRDSQTDIWGLIIKPTNFDPSKKYPVIEYIYAGPHSSHVPKGFRPNYAGLNELAELGFIVVQIDGMGTSNRSKAFHDIAWKNLKDAGFPDRIKWLQAAAKTRTYMDIDNVGIFGTSAGGQSSAGALVFFNDFYKVAVSSCGCHDNRMDKIWWNEQWMGYPIGSHYEECSNTANASKLQGKLLLIVGELDDNVDPASTLQFADALIKEMKDFDMIFVPGMGHSSGGAYGEKKRRDFFVKNLLGVNPPSWN
ncbi:S9 family peptidase [Aquiflexum lacus]|uniref:S9 family peptidase n=1 Tax=Aquiflexum lacus TaxID=2483805 RepID=UPI001894B320|nr:S9 family peptidase [Aquiflexum lacus]